MEERIVQEVHVLRHEFMHEEAENFISTAIRFRTADEMLLLKGMYVDILQRMQDDDLAEATLLGAFNELRPDGWAGVIALGTLSARMLRNHKLALRCFFKLKEAPLPSVQMLSYIGITRLLRHKFSDYNETRRYYHEATPYYPTGTLEQLRFYLTQDYPEGQELLRVMSRRPIEDFPARPILQAMWHDDIANDYDGAQRHYEIAIMTDDPYYDISIIQFEYGMFFLNKRHNYDEARRHITLATSHDPKYCEAHYRLALLLLEKFFDVEGAERHFRKVQQINPRHVDSRAKLDLIAKTRLCTEVPSRKRLNTDLDTVQGKQDGAEETDSRAKVPRLEPHVADGCKNEDNAFTEIMQHDRNDEEIGTSFSTPSS